MTQPVITLKRPTIQDITEETPVANVHIFTTPPLFGPAVRLTGKLAIFDLDGTLIRRLNSAPNHAPKSPYDFDILPNRKESLEYLLGQGYNLVGMTNQGWPRASLGVALDRIKAFMIRLGLPMVIFVSTAASNSRDPYRKPSPNMWEFIRQTYSPPASAQQKSPNGIKEAFFVGDAAGRQVPKDFSAADIEWAANVSEYNHHNPGIAFSTPEDFFPHTEEPVLQGRVMAVLVGAPGSGKSTFAEKVLVPAGYTVISQDVLGNRNRVLKETAAILATGKPIAIDNTNGSLANRQEFFDLARDNAYQVVVYYFVREGEPWNAARGEAGGKKVPPVAYGVYYRDVVPPTPENTPGPVYQVW